MGFFPPNNQHNKWNAASSLPKSIAFVFKRNSTKTEEKPFAQNAIGRRQEGDELMHFESHNVTNYSRFPSRVFEYSGLYKGEYITYVGFSFNVSILISLNYKSQSKV